MIYPAYLYPPDNPAVLQPVYTPNQFTPPTFLLQAENDKGYGKNAPLYFQALAAANVPTELHMYATGGHGFGLHPVGRPEEHWTQLATAWLRSIRILPPPAPASELAVQGILNGSPGTAPCPVPPQPGRLPANTNPASTSTDPACW